MKIDRIIEMRIIIVILFSCIFSCLSAEKVIVLNYDYSGNRTSRMVKITDVNGIDMQIIKDEPIATDLGFLDLSVKATPNPTPGLLHVEMNCEDSEVNTLSIYTIRGKLVDQKSNAIIDFDLSKCPIGTYLLVIDTKFGKSSCKIIKK